MCLFCGDKTNAADQYLQKVNLTQQIALGEEYIVAFLAQGDLVPIEARYHRNCYTRFTRYYDAICKHDTASENIEATAENELLQYIKEEVDRGRRFLTL